MNILNYSLTSLLVNLYGIIFNMEIFYRLRFFSGETLYVTSNVAQNLEKSQLQCTLYIPMAARDKNALSRVQ